MERITQQKRSPLFLLTIGLCITLIIILIMGWNIYWENLKHKQTVEQQITQQQQYFNAIKVGNIKLAQRLTSHLPQTKNDFQQAQEQLKQKLAYYHLDIVVTLIAMSLAILSLILTWIFILRTLLTWKKQIDHVNQILDQKVTHKTKKLKQTHQQLNQEIQENISLTEVLHRNQKLQAVGTLAAGIAHDYNNYLAVILAHSEFLHEQSHNEATHDASKNIINTTHKASQLTQHLLSFARKGKHERRTINLNETIVEAVKMLQPNMTNNITIDTHYEESIWPVAADKNQLLQILINLGLNARDAMPNGGDIIISCQNQDFTNARVLPDANLSPQKYASISVKDFGIGIEPEHQTHIFAPFYTTKDIGKGTGLGLAVAYGIMQQHQGILTVTSDPNIEPGAIFTLYFPA